MKNLIFLLSFILLLSSCTENPPVIPPLSNGGGGGPVAGERKVLVEEFTGVRCVNCPDGSAEIQNLISSYGDRLVAVSIHTGFFANPLSESTLDFRTADGDAITGLFGAPQSYPSAIINRNDFGTADIFASKQSWAGHIQSELEEKPKLNIELKSTYTDTDRNVKVDVKIIPVENAAEQWNLTVILTEDDIENAQLLPDGLKEDYIHRHVFRKALTNTNGESLGQPTENMAKTYNFTVPATWKVNDCHIIALVHKAGPDYNVYQVEQVKMK